MNRSGHPDGFAWRSWREQISQDVRYALRSWSRHRVGTAVVLLTLALGIGGTSAIFSVVNGVLLRPLPYENPDRLVRLVENIADDTPQGWQVRRAPALDVSDLETFRQRVSLLSDVGVYAPTAMTWAGEGEAWRLPAARVSPSIFGMLGARPLVGRLFDEDDGVAGAGSVLILSHQAWQQHGRRDPNIIGRTVTLDGRAFTVVGVVPEGFLFPDPHTLIWVPLPRTGAGRLPVIARVADGTTREAAAEEFVRVMRALQRDTEPTPGGASAGVPQFELVGVQEALVAPVRPALTMLSIAVAFVMMICCVNVASLLLARALVRRPEIAVRRALGATRARIFGQVITECIMLALVAGVAGVVLAVLGVEALRELGTGLIRRDLGPGVSIPRLNEVRIDGTVLFVTFAISLGAGLLFGIAPAFWHARTDVMAGLRDVREAAAGGGPHWRRNSIHGPLVVAQITLAMMLLIGAALQIHSFARLSSMKLGYDPSNVLTFQIARSGGATRSTLGEEVISQVRLLPGVLDAGYAGALPMVQTGFRAALSTTPNGPPLGGGGGTLPIDSRLVSRDFLRTLGVRLIAGRTFGEYVAPGKPGRELLINRTLAQSGHLGEHPIGRQVFSGPFASTIVGVVDDVRQFGLNQEPEPQIFSMLAASRGSEYYAVRTLGVPAELTADIRRIVHEIEPGATMDSVATMNQIVSHSIARPRLYATLFGLFGMVAAVIAIIGLYAVIAYTVTRRTREIGIRIALGALPADVRWMIVRDAMALVSAGIGLGVAGALALNRSLVALLFGIEAADPATYGVAAVTLALVALVASSAAASPALRVDPVIALRAE